jgi:LysM repeat protein
MPLVGGLVAALALFAPTVLAAQQPQAHTVAPGNTLWSLSQQYLGDPLLWPEIYRLNTDVVEDPHWIYPGEVLRLAPAAGISAVPAQDTPGPDSALAEAGVKSLAELTEADERQQGGLFPMMGSYGAPRETIRAYSEENYRPVRQGEFYGASFLTEEQKLPLGRVVARVSPMQISTAANVGYSKLYGETELSAPKGAVYEVGDSLLVVAKNGKIDDYGEILTPTGIVVVSRLDAGRPIARTVKLFNAVVPGQWVLPLEAFPAQQKARAAPVTDGIAARVLGWPSRGDLQEPQQYVFLDKGRTEGVALGDLFEVQSESGGYYRDGTSRTTLRLATVQVVHLNDRSATAIVVGVTYSSFARGAAARQVAKLPG